jgi:hypothetical protein
VRKFQIEKKKKKKTTQKQQFVNLLMINKNHYVKDRQNKAKGLLKTVNT